jgi:alpha-galactosidase/6-phospho-beta-glucosidase family protein
MAAKPEVIDIKIAYIGGGSKYWARMIMTDLALTPYLKGELALFDLNLPAAKKNTLIGVNIFKHPDSKTRFKVTASSRLSSALRGADFVFISILPGPMQMMANDLDIPLKYGILQTVGDTTGPGGISRALRTLPTYFHFAQMIMKHCPKAWVINYTNPMTLCTQALYEAEPDIKAFGCCHEVFGTQYHLSELAAKYWGISPPSRQKIKTDISGLNHFTFISQATYKGQDLFPLLQKYLQEKGHWSDKTALATKMQDEGKFFDSQKLISHDFYRRFGVLGAAEDRHLVEFVPWYLSSMQTLHRYGVTYTPSSYRMGTWAPPGNAPGAKLGPINLVTNKKRLKPSGEEGVDQILALTGIKDLDTNINIPNQGQIPELPMGHVVESNSQFRLDSIKPVVTRQLPEAINVLLHRITKAQQLTMQAAISRSKELALQAMLIDPLINIDPDLVHKMLTEMMKANSEMLAGWK